MVDRLAPGLDAAMRIVLLEAVSAAADEITSEMAPGSVEIRLRGSDPEFVVTLPDAEPTDAGLTAEAAGPGSVPQTSPSVIPFGEVEGGTARLNLRLPENLKARVEEVATREGLSLNAWLVRAAATAVESSGATARSSNAVPMSQRTSGGGQRLTGWIR